MNADSHLIYTGFQVGEFMMIHIRPERFLQGIVERLQTRNVGPFEILKRVGHDVYVIDLPPVMGVNPIFKL